MEGVAVAPTQHCAAEWMRVGRTSYGRSTRSATATVGFSPWDAFEAADVAAAPRLMLERDELPASARVWSRASKHTPTVPRHSKPSDCRSSQVRLSTT